MMVGSDVDILVIEKIYTFKHSLLYSIDFTINHPKNDSINGTEHLPYQN